MEIENLCWVWYMDFGDLGLEFWGLGKQEWDSILGFGVWGLSLGILEFEFSILRFWV